MRRSAVPRFLLLTLFLSVPASLVTACGGGESGPIALPSRTGSGLPSRTASIAPTRTASGLPTRDESTPVTEPTNQPTTQPTQPPPTQPTTQPTQPPPTQPTTQPTSQPTQPPTTRITTKPTTGQESSAPPADSSSTASASGGASTAEEADTSSDDISPWWWVALAAALAAVAVLVFLLVRRSRRRRWRADLAGAEQEVGWFARDLVPQLRGSGSLEGVAGGWTVAVPRVIELDDRLTRLVTTAPTEEDRVRASTVQDAVRSARDQIAALVASEGSETWALDLDSAQAPLLAALVPPASAAEQAPGSAPGQ